MSVPVGTDAPSQPPTARDRLRPPTRAAAPPIVSAPDTVAGTCPYLASVGGSWRSAVPSRDHRCSAVAPAAAQSTDKQRRHCLSADHVDCPAFRAARTARTSSLAAGADVALIEFADRRRRPIGRTSPVILEPAGLVDQAMRLQLDRAPGQVALVALMVVAFAVVAIARLSAASPTPAASSVPSLVAAASSEPSRAPAPTASSVAPSSSAVAPSSVPPTRTTYTVKKGDTLNAIAKRYNTTAAIIRAANGMKTNSLKIGQVLKIP